MRIYFDLLTQKLIEGVDYNREVTALEGKRRDFGALELVAVESNAVVELTAPWTIRAGLKIRGAYTGPFLASSATWSKQGEGAGTFYRGDFSLNTTEVNAAFVAAGEPASLACMLEIQLSLPGKTISSPAVDYTLANDVIRGDEGTPTAGTPAFPLPNEIVQILWGVTDLTGTGGTSLRALTTVGVTTPRMFMTRTDVLRTYRLRAGTDAADGLRIIRPLDYDATTNAKVYELES